MQEKLTNKLTWRQGHCAIISFQTVYFHSASPQKKDINGYGFQKILRELAEQG